MSDPSLLGVLYTEHVRLKAGTPLASLWSYQTRHREGRPPVVTTTAGNQEYWLDRSDPLLNTILPGTAVSVIVNLGDRWSSGRSLIATELMPRLCVVGPFTQSRLLRVGRDVRAVGAVLPATFAHRAFGISAPELVDQIAPLDDLWPRSAVDRLAAELSRLDDSSGVMLLEDVLVARITRDGTDDAVGWAASRLITRRAGRVSIDALAGTHGLSRQEFARRFRASAGLPPKQFARISRFQALIYSLLTTDVSRWAFEAPALGFYDQAHMINEFRAFTGSSPRTFFRPHDETIDAARVQISGRPHEWLRPKSGSIEG